MPVIVTLRAVLKGLESNNGVTINYNTNTNTNTKYKSLEQIRAIVKGDKHEHTIHTPQRLL